LYAARSAASDATDARTLATKYDGWATAAAKDGEPDLQTKYHGWATTQRSDAGYADQRVAAQKGLIEQACTDRDTAANTAISQIESATTSDGLNDTWWDNWGSKIVHIIADVAQWISTITGILALLVCWIPIIGQALAATLLLISAISACVAAVANIVLAATGEESWTAALVSVAFAALSCIGLGSLKAGLGVVKAAATGWRNAGGIAGQGGLRGALAASGRNFVLSAKNLGKLAKLKFSPATTARAGSRVDDDIYAMLRSKTPTTDIGQAVNQNALKIGAQDFAIPGKTIDGPLQADHIVSVDRINKMDGFKDLTETQQLTVLNYPDNFIGLSRSANASKGASSYADWLMHQKSGLMVNPLFTTEMTHLDTALSSRLQALTDSFR
jgi:hypothetical protein